MKKMLFILNMILIAIVCAGEVCYSLFGGFWLQFCFGLILVILTATNLIYVLKTKSKNRRYAYFIGAGTILAFASELFVTVQPISCVSLSLFSVIGYYIALMMAEKFKWQDFVVGVGIAIPSIIAVTSSKMFGYGGVFGLILAIVYIWIVACTLGKAISNLIRNKNSTNVLTIIASAFLFLSAFVLLICKFSNVSNTFNYILIATNYISQIVFTYSIHNRTFVLKKVEKNEENKDINANQKAEFTFKKSIMCAVSAFVIAVLAGYALVSSFINFNVASAKVTKEEFLEEVGEELKIPVVEIDTNNKDLPRNKEDYVNCSFSIDYADDSYQDFYVRMADNYGDEGSVGIRLRGNSTMIAKKKPYRIKFDEKQSFFGLKENKSWVLLADFYDQSYLRNYTAFKLADGFDENDDYFSPTGHHVALVINGEFKGLYLLCEQMDEKKGRAAVEEDIDVSIQTEFPFLVEMDLNAYKEGTTGVDNFYVEGLYPVEIKYPEADERGATADSDKVYDYIYEYINAVFTLVRTGGTMEVSFREDPVSLTDLVDLDSAAHFYLVNEIMLNADSIWKSIYFSKTIDGKMEFGPVWDFDFSMSTEWEIPYDKSHIEDAQTLFVGKNSLIFNELFKYETFYNLVTTKFNSYKQVILDIADELKYYKDIIDEVALIDTKMWHGTNGETEYDMQYDYVRLFLQDRYVYLNEVFNKTHSEFLQLI